MKELLLALLICLFVGLIIIGPFALVWSLNTLFPVLAIPYNFNTWAASLFILSIFNAKLAYNNKKQ